MTKKQIDKAVRKIKKTSTDDLLNQFETLLREGAGQLSIPLIWIRQEIRLRMIGI